MNWNHPHELARRATATGWVITAVLAVLIGAFFRLQVLGKDRYSFQSEQNRVRPVVLPAPRGLITDRHGEVLAENIPSYTISLLVPSPDVLERSLHHIAAIADLDSTLVQQILANRSGAVGNPITILKDAPFDVVSALEERRRVIPGLVIQTEPKRWYPHGEILAHVLGYVNEVTEPELETEAFEGARRGTLVGRTGLEREYDDRLRGADGRRFVEVDAMGRTVRSEGVVSVLDPDPGETIRTTLDLELQRYATSEFPEGMRGALVAMDPRTGDVLALVSAPSFDPNAFVGGIDPELWQLWSTSPGRPLFNRAVQGRYPPASPWKLAVASMALKRGIVGMRTRMPLPCHGGMQFYNRYFRCWRAQGHGSLTLAEAIRHSCDVYFYQLGLQLGLQNVLDDGIALGFAQRTDIDLPNEVQSLFPPSTDYYDRLYGPRGWTRAVTLNLAIGQGENDQTVINVVRFYAMLANGDGMSPRPRLLLDGTPDRSQSPTLGLDGSDIMALRQSLVSVVESGTAVRSRIADLRIAGKTGTAQNSHGADHGWFVAFAPADEPQVVVGAIVEFGEHGSDVAPMVTRVIARHLLGPDAVLDRGLRLEMPLDSAPRSIPVSPDSLARVIGPF
jgi:penicillin-binding protein 2